MGTKLKYWGNSPPGPRRRKVSRPFGMKTHPFNPITGEHLPIKAASELGLKNSPGEVEYPGGVKSYPSGRVPDLEEEAQKYDMVMMNAADQADFLSSKVAGSIMPNDDDKLELDGDQSVPGASKVYGTDEEGTKGWQDASVGAPEDPGAEVDTIGSAAEGDEAAEASTWEAGNESEHGLAIWVQTRAAYYDAGDEVLYGYFRLMTYDQYGRLYSVGAETRVTIDTPVAES